MTGSRSNARTRGVLSLAVILSLVVAGVAFAGVSTAQRDRTTGTNASDLTLSDLRRPGEQFESDAAPESLRMGSNTESWTVKYDAPKPLSEKDWYYLGEQDMLRSDTLDFKSIRMGSNTSEKQYTVEIAYWSTDTKKVKLDNGTVAERQVANVSHIDHKTITAGPMYDVNTISLQSKYEDPQRVTMCIGKGCLKSGAGPRWSSIKHQSIPTSQQVPISNRGDLLAWIFKHILLWAIPLMFVAVMGAKHALNRAKAPPALSSLTWGLILGGVAFLLVVVAYFKTVVIFSRLPQIIAFVLGLIVFVTFLEGFDDRIKRVLFSRSELGESRNPWGEEIEDSIYEEIHSHRVVEDRDSGEVHIVERGIIPFVARYFAKEGAVLDIEDLRTRIETKGSWSERYIADPDCEKALKYTPARLSWDPPLFTGEGDGSLGGLISSLNYGFLFTALLGLTAGWYVFETFLGIGSVGLVVGALPGIVMCIQALPGYAWFKPAPIHMRRSIETLATAQEDYEHADSLEQAQRAVWDERMSRRQDVEEELDKVDDTLVEKVLGGRIDRSFTDSDEESKVEESAAGSRVDSEETGSIFETGDGPRENGHARPEEADEDD
ncbi:MAG: hypothetical protein ABEI77_07590 [Halorientalis sp.]